MESDRLRELLLAEIAGGRLSDEIVLSALESAASAERARTPLRILHDALCVHGAVSSPAQLRLVTHVESVALGLAQDSARKGEACPDLDTLFLPEPRDFVRKQAAVARLADFMQLSKDRKHAAAACFPDELRAAIDEEWRSCKTELLALPIPWGETCIVELVHAHCGSAGADEESAEFLRQCISGDATTQSAALEELTVAFDASEDRTERESLLDRILDLDSDLVLPFLIECWSEPWVRLRIAVAVAHRLPHVSLGSTDRVIAWLRQRDLTPSDLQRITAPMRKEVLEALQPVDFIHRWSSKVGSLRSLLRREPPPIPADLLARACAESRPSTPKAPSLWATQFKPFFADNWYIFVGLLMLVVGCSIVAYYTWDRHWLWRYTLLPALLGAFTFALAGLGTWIEKKAEGFRGTAASLRAAATCLLPVNFMTIAYLAGDPQIAGRGLVTTIAVVAYFALFGWGLRRWCRAVFSPLAALLGAALLLINGLVVLRPLAESLPSSWVSPANIPVVLGVGFHLGFFALAVVIIVFGRRHLTKDIAQEKIVPWFIGGTLVATFLQVLAWVHASLGSLPEVHTYASMTILAGGLLLFVERRVLALDKDASPQRSESFLGFALVLLGCLMAQANEVTRVLGFLLASAVWLYQARGRGHQAQQWIGLILLALGVASVGLVDAFPEELRPSLGFALAAGFIWSRAFARKRGDSDLEAASHGMRDAVLVLASMVAVIGQWNDDTQPWIAAVYLLANAVLFCWFAHREGRLQLLHTAMLLVILVLPFVGCVDLVGRSLHGNTMVFGIAIVSLLWLLQNWLLPTKLTLRARSTVLWTYGALAVVGMLLRVVIERGTAGDALWYRQAMDYLGPLLMAFVLVFATYFSRSLVPALMGTVIVIILFPELKARFEVTFSQLGWGSGLGSSISALCLCVLAFVLRRSSFLKALTPGDRLLGVFDFPLRRFDHTLFTWPLLASAIFLIARTETWTLYRNLSSGMSARTAWAVVITGSVWTCLAAYFQAMRHARTALYLGCLSFGAGFFLLYWQMQIEGRFDWQMPTLWTFLLLQLLYWSYTVLLVPRFAWAREQMAEPTMHVLRLAVRIVAVLLTFELTLSSSLEESIWLVSFVALHTLWDACRGKGHVAGTLLFGLTFVSVLAAFAEEGTGWLVDFTWPKYGATILIYLLTIQVIHILVEGREKWWRRSLALPFQIGSLMIAGLLCLPFMDGIASTQQLTDHAKWLLLVVLLLQARTWRFTGLLILSLSLGYLWFFVTRLGLVPEIAAPWRLSVFALVLTLFHAAGLWLHARVGRIIETPWMPGPNLAFTRHWMLALSAGLACVATLMFVSNRTWRADNVQLSAPYFGTAALMLASTLWPKRRMLYIAALVFTIGNVQLVRLAVGPWLLERGLSEVHLCCLGMALTLAFVASIRRFAKDTSIGAGMDRASMALAGATLVLLSANYLIRHSLADITPMRFVVSGALAYGASLVFRNVGRRIEKPDSKRASFCESAYHFGVTIALWCAALLIPALREPKLALLALSLPVYWFALRAETAWRAGSALLRPYRNSATTIACLLLALYAFRAAFQVVLFPERELETLYYHMSAPFVIVIGLVLIRLRALGAGYWTGFYGGLAVMVGSYFAVTSFPALRPFEHPLAGAAVAILLAHFWTVVTTQRSPLRSVVQRLGAIADEDWQGLRTMWGITLLFGTQILALVGVLQHDGHPRAVAPLILLSASLVLHHGVLRQISLYFILGAAQVLLALHADFWVESWLDRDHVIWVLLAIFFCGLVASLVSRQRGRALLPGVAFAALTLFVSLHVFHHGPWSTVALWAVGLQTAMCLFVPRARAQAVDFGEGLACALLLAVPVWLAFFSQVEPPGTGSPIAVLGIFETWPVLCGLGALLGVAAGALACSRVFRERIETCGRELPCLLHQLLHLLRARGELIFMACSGLTLLMAGLLQVEHYDLEFDPPAFALFCAIWVSLLWGSWSIALRRKSALVFVVMEICVAALFLLIRKQLVLTTGFWSSQHDVWCSIIAAVLLVGMQRVFEKQAKAFIVPVSISILALPVVGILLTLVNGLGTNVALFVVGLHSLLFSYMGKDNRESPYNILAVGGFVSFVMIVFWSKLELRSIQAYVLPVGFGILFLLQLFRERLGVAQRNGIRLVTVLAMLLSCAYYAVADLRYPLAFNLTLLLFSLASMGLGGFLRIRIYLSLGLTGVLLSLGSIMYRIGAGLERGVRMTAVGLLVLLVGACLVAGAIYYKTHKERIGARIDGLRKKLGDWE